METKSIIESCLKICDTGSPGERFRAAEQLVGFGEAAVPEILSALRSPLSLELAETCTWALGKIGINSDEVQQALTEISKSKQTSLSSKANYSLSLLKATK